MATSSPKLSFRYWSIATPIGKPFDLTPPQRRFPPPIVPNVAVSASVPIVRFDLHMHSSASFDCRVPASEVARRCRQLGLSPIFLTDHDVIDGARSLIEAGESAILGEEILTTEGELIGLFLK